MIKLNSFSNIFDDTNQKIVHTLKEYRNNLEEIQEKLNSSKNMYYQVLHYNIEFFLVVFFFFLVTKNRDIL